MLFVITAFHQVATFGQTAEEAPPYGNGKRVCSHSDELSYNRNVSIRHSE